MAPLTWREVAAPNFSGVSESQRLAATLLSNGFGGLSDAIGNLKKSQGDTTTSEYLSRIAGYGNDPQALDAALKSGTIYDGLNRGAISPEALKYGAEREGQLIDYAGKTLSNQNQGITNDRASFELSGAKRDDQLAQSRLAAQPEAAKLLATVQNLAGSGDPAKIEQARGLITDNAQTFLNAGYKADAIPGLLDAARSTGTAGFGYKKDVLENTKFWENQGITENARNIAQDAINSNATPDVAIRTIQERTDIKDPRIKAQAIQVIQQAADAKVFQQADPAQALLSSLGVQYGVPTVAPGAAPVPGSNVPASGGGNPLVNLIDAKEGGGDYSTLYGHAQKNGGAFSGVDVSTQTIGALKQFASSDGAYGRHQKSELGYLATPMGRYQIVGDTLSKTAKAMGLPDDTVFTPDVQDAMFDYLATQRLSGPRTMEGKIAGLRQEWAGFKNVPDNVLAQAITAYQNGDKTVLRGAAQNQGAAPTTASVTRPAPVAAPRITLPVGGDPAAQLSQSVIPSLSDRLGGRVDSPSSSDVQAQPEATTAAPSFRESEQTSMSTLRRDQNQLQNEIDATRGQGEAARLAAAAVPTAAAVPPQATNASSTAASSTPAQGSGDTTLKGIQNDAQNLIDQSILDKVFNRNSALIKEITQNPNRNETPAQTAERLIGKDGLLPGGNQQAVLQAINETIQMSGGKLTPSAAGAIVANNAESRDMTAWYLPRFLEGDRFSNANESKAAATRTNMGGVANNLKQLGINVDGSINLSKGVSQIQDQRVSEVTGQQITAMQAQLLTSTNEAANIAAAIQRGQDTPANRAALTRALQVVQQLKAILDQVGAQPGSPTTIYSKAAETPPTK